MRFSAGWWGDDFVAIVLVVAGTCVLIALTFFAPGPFLSCPLDFAGVFFARVVLATGALSLTRALCVSRAVGVPGMVGIALTATTLDVVAVVLVGSRMLERRQRTECDGQNYDPMRRLEGAHASIWVASAVPKRRGRCMKRTARMEQPVCLARQAW